MDSGGPWYGGEQRPWLVPALVGGGVIILIILIVGALAVRGRGSGSPTATHGAATATNQIILAPGGGSPVGSPIIGGVGRTPSAVAGATAPTGATSPAVGGAKPTATASAAAKVFVVTGTGGEGLNLRDAPGGNLVTTLPDGTRLEQAGPDQQDSSGATWHNVRTPDGTTGWVSAQFTQEAP
ncbi:MAG TPA: SH3 domain-containing protein [Thermomicrobiales bacterium]|nr:SH3 domain-containing protein [Thermomicrobiales bacterium]